jgi:hypothetical protein
MMKCFLLVVFLFPILAIAQQKDLTDSTEFRYGLPVSNDDTVRQVRSDLDPANQWVEVAASQIPKKLKRALERNEALEDGRREKFSLTKASNNTC